jgi:hypothetical protein
VTNPRVEGFFETTAAGRHQPERENPPGRQPMGGGARAFSRGVYHGRNVRAGIATGKLKVCLLALAAALLVVVVAGPPAIAGGGLPPPQSDSFYTYTASRPLGTIAPGTVLKRRSTHLAFGTTTTPIAAEQLLYRTTDQLGEPSVTVTTVIAPALTAVLPRIVGYLSFYDGLGSKCDPSFTIRGGQPDPTTAQQAQEEELLFSWYLAHGFIVTVPDFEGTGLHWMAGRESGYGTLDALRATESYLHAPASTPIGLSGYSGGAVAADWASELAPAYAPKLHLVGVAEAGIPANYAHMFAYINGTTVYSAAIPGVLLGLARAYHLDLAPYLSAYGARVVNEESSVCIDEVFSHYPGLTLQAMMKPQYRDFFNVPVFRQILADQQMGTARTHPAEPLLMGVGNSDGNGDGVMSAADVVALTHHYCREGVPVDFQEYQGVSHEVAGAFFEPQTGAFFLARFAGAPFVSTCSSS